MSAPRSRRLRNQTAPVTRSREEMTIAIVGSIAIVVITLILIWAMRPGDTSSLTEGKGGLVHRQPKAALWLLATIAGVFLVAWFVLRRDSKLRRKPIMPLLIGITGVVIISVAALVIFNDNIVNDYAPPTTFPEVTAPPNTTAPPATTAPPTTAAGATTTPPTTAAGGTTTPSTGG